MPKEPRRVPTVLGRVQNGLVSRPRGSFFFFQWRVLRFCRRIAEIDSPEAGSQIGAIHRNVRRRGHFRVAPKPAAQFIGISHGEAASRLAGIPSFAQRWATFTDKARNWAMAFQPRKIPGSGAAD